MFSRSGLAFNYVPRLKCEIPTNAFCGAMLKTGLGPLSEPIACEVVHKVPAWTGPRAAVTMERCGIRFKRLLTVSDMESLLSAWCPPIRAGSSKRAGSTEVVR